MGTGPMNGQVAIVTGASSGIGRDTALELARHGVRLVLASRNGAALEQVAAAVSGIVSRADGLAIALAPIGSRASSAVALPSSPWRLGSKAAYGGSMVSLISAGSCWRSSSRKVPAPAQLLPMVFS